MKEISSWIRDQVEVYEDSNDAIERFAMFYKEMKSRGYKKKVEQINQFQLDFGDHNDYDDHFEKAVKEFEKRANQLTKEQQERLNKKR